MDQFSDRGPGDEPAQVSQWLFSPSWRRRRNTVGMTVLVIVLVALVVTGVLVLTAAFFPR